MKTYSVDEALELADARREEQTRRDKLREWARQHATPLPARASRAAMRTLQRARKGWAEEDALNLDQPLSRVIGEGLVFLADNTLTYPAEGDFMTMDAWRRHLRKSGWALLTYADDLPDTAAPMPDDAVRLEEAKEALRWVADNLELLRD